MTASNSIDSPASSNDRTRQRYNLFLLLVAGLGGLLYGIDVGIIGGALPYLEATSKLIAIATLHHRGRRTAWQRLLHAVRRHTRRLDGT